MRHAPFRSLLLALCAVLTVAWAAPADRVPPRPVEVSEVGDAPAGEVAVEPAQLGLTLAPATAELADLRVVNGSDREVSLSVEVSAVGAGPGGAPVVPGEDDPVPSAAEWVALPAAEVHLAPSEAAAFRPAVAVPEGTGPGGYLAAVRFTGMGDEEADGTADGEDVRAADGPEVVAFVLVEVPGGAQDAEDAGVGERAVDVSVRRVDRTSAVATATLDAGRRGAVEVTGRVQVRSWYGTTLIDTSIPSTLVLPGVPREREIGFRAPVVPGPYRVVVEEVAGPGVELGAASGRAWLWNPAAVIALAVLLLVVSGWLVWRTARR